MKSFLLLALSALLVVPQSCEAGRPFLCCDHNGGKVCVVSSDGNIEWEFACRAPQDCWKLDNGNFLFCYFDGAVEVTKSKQVVWKYQAPEKTEVHACQPLADGKVLICECGTSRLLEVDRTGKVAKEIPLKTTPEIHTHNQFRGARKTKEGHYLVRSIKVPGDPHEVVPLADGHLLITCGDGHKVIEIDDQEKVVWELNETDLPGNPLRLMAGCQRLPNGNTIFCNYLGHGHIGKQPQFFEVTQDKKVVWRFDDHAHFKTINQIFVLDQTGEVRR